MKMLTEKQAYVAMFHFLNEAWKRYNAMQVGDILSNLAFLSDGKPADPAMTKDWEESVDFALNGGKVDMLVLRPPGTINH